VLDRRKYKWGGGEKKSIKKKGSKERVLLQARALGSKEWRTRNGAEGLQQDVLAGRDEKITGDN